MNSNSGSNPAASSTCSPSPKRERSLTKVLYVSWGVPPAVSGSTEVARGLAAALTSEKIVLAGANWPRKRANAKADVAGTYYVFDEGMWSFRGARYLAWLRWLWLPKMVAQLTRIAELERCTSVVGVYPDELFLAAAWLVARRLRLPFFPYFHNTYRENRRGLRRFVADRLQPRVLRDASLVLVISDALSEHFVSAYPGRLVVAVPHTGPVDSFVDFGTTRQNEWPRYVGFLGAVNASNLDAFARMVRAVALIENARLIVASTTPAWFFINNGVDISKFEMRDVPLGAEIAFLRECQLVLLPHGLQGALSELEYNTIFPTRTVYYLSSGVPIVAHVPEGCGLEKWLKKYDCAEIFTSQDERDMAAHISRLLADESRLEQLRRNAVDAVKLFDSQRVSALFINALAEPHGDH